MTSASRTRVVAALLLLATALAGCGSDEPDERPGGAEWTGPSASASPTQSATPSASATPAAPGASPSAPPRAGRMTPPPAGPGEPGRASTPPFVMPTRSAGAPSARQVVDAFRAAKLPVPNLRDRSVDCGPDGAGLGCAELLVTDAVSVYVFPDEASATNRTDMWGDDAYRDGTVVLSYLDTSTSAAQRKRYDAVLAGLR
ncbi:hypothetical protein O7606_10995 [Micromonospora sp. WMMD882]|uniref:hypothetical protein n=1 Tax=Micromonospora sp. WMMD882 TaxID=3015151 RepID=UPI00248B4232|nr:hypothetical protein [Micromonospora sp. WMMD882]WBB81831.1 hypothetical protein O7606_10995 [Micromonospora sp. WMMD882]